MLDNIRIFSLILLYFTAYKTNEIKSSSAKAICNYNSYNCAVKIKIEVLYEMTRNIENN